jgi:hypothetical protein
MAATFPKLSSGAVMQYPATAVISQAAQVIRFLDGQDQRYLTRGRASRRWLIKLDLLTDSEAAALESFFQQHAGSYTAFEFPDPFTGTAIPNCRFGSDLFVRNLASLNSNNCSLWVVETNG